MVDLQTITGLTVSSVIENENGSITFNFTDSNVEKSVNIEAVGDFSQEPAHLEIS